MTAVAVKVFEVDWTLNIVSTVIAGPSLSVEPNPSCHSTRSPSTTTTARPGTCSWAISAGILAR